MGIPWGFPHTSPRACYVFPVARLLDRFWLPEVGGFPSGSGKNDGENPRVGFFRNHGPLPVGWSHEFLEKRDIRLALLYIYTYIHHIIKCKIDIKLIFRICTSKMLSVVIDELFHWSIGWTSRVEAASITQLLPGEPVPVTKLDAFFVVTFPRFYPVQSGEKTRENGSTPKKDLVKHTEIRLKLSLNGGCLNWLFSWTLSKNCGNPSCMISNMVVSALLNVFIFWDSVEWFSK